MKGYISFDRADEIAFGFGVPLPEQGAFVEFDVERIETWGQRVEPPVGAAIGEIVLVVLGGDIGSWKQLDESFHTPRRTGIYLGRNLVLTAKLRDA